MPPLIPAPAALLFDLDGTLLDSAPDLAAAVDAMLTERNLAPAGVEAARQWVGNGAAKLVSRALAHATNSPEDCLPETDLAAALEQFFSFYQRNYAQRSQLYPGVREALAHWHQQGIQMACVTNKPARFTEPLLAHFGLDGWLGAVVSGDTLAVKKPDPAPLLLACRQLAVAPQQSWMVGDSVNDVQAARAAGMAVACVDYGYNHGRPISESAPDRLVSNLLQLID